MYGVYYGFELINQKFDLAEIETSPQLFELEFLTISMWFVKNGRGKGGA